MCFLVWLSKYAAYLDCSKAGKLPFGYPNGLFAKIIHFNRTNEIKAHPTEFFSVSCALFLVIYYLLVHNLLTSGKLNSYLADIEEQAQNLFSRLVKDLAEKENVNEELKATDQMLWVRKMNNIRNRATEIVNADIIYKV